MNYKPLNIVVIFTFLVGVLAVYMEWISFWLLFALILLYLIFLLIISTNVQWNFFVNAFNGKPAHIKKEVALTFDDGPVESTLQILELLKKYNAKASFFCIGKNIEANPQIFKKIIKEGHLVGNHTFSHTRKMGFLNKAEIISEINKCDSIALKTGGVKLKLYRPPFGITNPKIKEALEITEHQVVGWNVRSYDAVLSSKNYILKRIIKNIKPGAVILLHDNNIQTIEILEQLLLFLQTNDYRSVRVDNLFQIDAYS